MKLSKRLKFSSAVWALSAFILLFFAIFAFGAFGAADLGYDPVREFREGQSSFLSVGPAPFPKKEKDAIQKMWNAFIQQQARDEERGIMSDTLSSTIHYFTIGSGGEPGLRNVLVDAVIKYRENEENHDILHWLTARIRMLSDRYKDIIPERGSDEKTKSNLKIIKGWMEDLKKDSYFDKDIVVGMYKYKGDREVEKYSQDEATEMFFHNALKFYQKALSFHERNHFNEAAATLHFKIATLCATFRSPAIEKEISNYKLGFTSAGEGLDRIKIAKNERQRGDEKSYPYQMDILYLENELQKTYGNNYLGYIYKLFLGLRNNEIHSAYDHCLDVDFKDNFGTNKDGSNNWSLAAIMIAVAEKNLALAAKQAEDLDEYNFSRGLALKAGKAALQFEDREALELRRSNSTDQLCKVANDFHYILEDLEFFPESRQVKLNYSQYCPEAFRGKLYFHQEVSEQ